MSDLTVEMLREHLETDLLDEALQRLINDAEKEIIKQHGERTTQTDEFHGETLATALFLSRKAEEITTVVEEVKSGDSYEETTLAANDYKLRFEGRQTERLASGDNPRSTWGDVVTVVFVPKDDLDRRLRVAIDLVKLAVAYEGVEQQKVGDYSMKLERYENQKTAILKRLGSWGFA